MKTYELKPVSGHELHSWPEFQALCARLGVPFYQRTLGMTIKIAADPDAIVVVEHSYQGVDASKATEAVETTMQHNKEFRTFQPPAIVRK